MGSSEYATALSGPLLSGTILALVLSGGPTRGRKPEFRILPPFVFRTMRGPTAPLLQVFRL